MSINEIILSINNFVDHYKKYGSPHIENDFVLFKNSCLLQSNMNHYSLLNGILISFLTKGEINIEINDQNYLIKAPAVISVFPESTFGSYIELKEADIDSIFISLDCLADTFYLPYFRFLTQMMLTPVLKVSEQRMSYIQMFKYHLNELYKLKESPLHDLMVKTLLYALLIETTNNYIYIDPLKKSKESEIQYEVTYKFFKILRDIQPIERGVAYYADKLCVSTKYLSNVVKNITGFPPIKWINNALMLQAKKMLRQTDVSIEQISETLNFRSPAYFIYFFKKNSNLTPLTYRKLKIKKQKV